MSAPDADPAQPLVAVSGAVVAIALASVIGVRSGLVPALLFTTALGLGVVLFHSRFGFTSAWRQLVAVGQGRALRAQLLMLGVAATLFAPLLASQLSFRDVPVTASLFPLGWGLVVGALLFGLGMQLGGSCASGTLFSVGSGQLPIVLTLAGFVAGSVAGARTLPWWNARPAHDPVSLTQFGGYAGAWAITLTALALLAVASLAVERRRRRRHGGLPQPASPPTAHGVARAVRGSWPLWVGALGLAGLNALTAWLSGHAWGITFGFALWGSKLLDLLGVDVLGWGFWREPGNLAGYRAGVLGQTTSVMDLGVMVGALVASGLAGTWVLHQRVPWRLGVGAVAGGLLMGYGARLAGGCNIGAYVDGIATFGLNGWIWGGLALIGTAGGLALRPLFGLPVPRPTDSGC